MQLEAYSVYNNFLAGLHNVQDAKASEDDAARFAEIKADRTATLEVDEGESLSQEDLEDIYM